MSYFDFLSPPPALCTSPSLSVVCLFIYIGRDGGMGCRDGLMDGERPRVRGSGHLMDAPVSRDTT